MKPVHQMVAIGRIKKKTSGIKSEFSGMRMLYFAKNRKNKGKFQPIRVLFTISFICR